LNYNNLKFISKFLSVVIVDAIIL